MKLYYFVVTFLSFVQIVVMKYTITPTKQGNYKFKVSGWEDGKRTLRKFFTTKKEAQDYVNDVQIIGKGSVDTYKELSRNVTDEMLERLRVIDKTVSEALEKGISMLEEEARKAPNCQHVFNEFYKELKDEGKSERYLRDIDSRLWIFLKHYKNLKINLVTTEMVRSALKKHGKVANQTWNNQVTILRTYFNFAVNRKYITENPASFIKKRDARIGKGDPEVYTIEQWESLLEAEDKKIRLLFAIGGLTGMRTAELERMNYEDIDLDEMVITVGYEQAKKKMKRHINIYPKLLPYLKPLKGRKGLIFGNIKNSKKYRKFVEDLDFDLPQNGHRHSFASYFLAKEGKEKIYELWNNLGHVQDPDLLWNHYYRIVKKEDGEKYFSIK